MKITAFLQNAWFYDRVSEIRARQIMRDQAVWRRILARSVSGSRLHEALGPDLFAQIHWAEASFVIGRKSDDCPPANLAHIQITLIETAPDVVIAFGKVAEKAVRRVWDGRLIVCKHPSPRAATVADLAAMAAEVRAVIAQEAIAV